MTFGFRDTVQWRIGGQVIAQSGDQCVPGSWVFVHQSEVCIFYSITTQQLFIHSMCQAIVVGQIFEILLPDKLASGGVVTVKVFELGNMLHPDFDMPVLWQTDKYCTIDSKVCEY